MPNCAHAAVQQSDKKVIVKRIFFIAVGLSSWFVTNLVTPEPESNRILSISMFICPSGYALSPSWGAFALGALRFVPSRDLPTKRSFCASTLYKNNKKIWNDRPFSEAFFG